MKILIYRTCKLSVGVSSHWGEILTLEKDQSDSLIQNVLSQRNRYPVIKLGLVYTMT